MHIEHKKKARIIVLVVNKTSLFFSHRWNIARELSRRGEQLLLLSPYAKPRELELLKQHNIEWRAIPFHREGRYLSSFIKTFFYVIKTQWELEKKYEEVLFHLVTIIPILFCGIPLRLIKRPCVYAVSGMGTMFSSQKWKHKVGRVIVSLLYRFLMSAKSSRVIVQNLDDYSLLTNSMKIPQENIVLIRGSGVNLDEFPFVPKEQMSEVPIFILPGRLIREKGIFEAAELSLNLFKENIPHRMWIVGEPDPGNPLCLKDSEIEEMKQKNPCLEFLGFRRDMRALFEQADLVLFPSYREGLPKALLEASAVGRPIVAFDVPGVRELIINKSTGLLAPFGDIVSLTLHCKSLMGEPELRKSLIHKARKEVERTFAEALIIQQVFSIYETLLSR